MNPGDQAVDFLYLILLLVLVGSAFTVRRVPIGRTLQMLSAWALIFGAAFIGFTLKDDFVALGKRVIGETRGDIQAVEAEGGTMRIRQAPDGHFWVDGELNGRKVRFLVDSGATVTSISADTAERAGIEPGNGLRAMVRTANGVVEVQRGRAEQVRIGSISRSDLPVHISESFGDMNVLGMNFLSSLSGWSVEGQWLILKP